MEALLIILPRGKFANAQIAIEMQVPWGQGSGLPYSQSKYGCSSHCLGEWFQDTQSVSSVIQSCLTLCDPMDCSMPGLPVHHQLLEFTQTHVPWVRDAIQPSHPLLTPFPPAFSLSQHQGLFQWGSSSHQAAKVLEFQLQHQSFQWMFRTYFL